jgi:hypothetical protein
MEAARKNVVVCLHENFVREHISYIDRTSGERREFNQARIPHGTIIDGVDYGGWEFTAAGISPSALRGERWRDISLPADHKLSLRHSVFDAEGNLVLDEDGHRQTSHVMVDPTKLRDAVIQGRRRWARLHAGSRPLSERADEARRSSLHISDNSTSAGRGGLQDRRP